MKLRFHLLWDNDSERIYFSRIWSESDWPLRFCIKVDYMEASLSEREMKESGCGKYHVTIYAVSPRAAGKANVLKARESCGGDDSNPIACNEANCYSLISYGIAAPLWQRGGNNLDDLLRAARKDMLQITFMFGFYMDRPVNRIGDTGWDWIKGDMGAMMKRLGVTNFEQAGKP